MPLRLLTLTSVLCLPIAFAQGGCGSGPGGESPVPAKTPTALPQANAQAQGAPQGGIEGVVAVLPSASRFAAGQELAFVVTNGLAKTIYVEDMKTDCTIVTLEAQSGEGWETVWGCGMERLPRVVAIQPGGSEAVVIRPGSTHILTEGGVAPGTYRARFSYRLAPGPEGDEPEVALSAEFEIGS